MIYALEANKLIPARRELVKVVPVANPTRQQIKRHGGRLQRVDMEPWNWERLEPSAATANDRAILALDEALEKLTMDDRETSGLVKVHYLLGLPVKEAAALPAKLTEELRCVGQAAISENPAHLHRVGEVQPAALYRFIQVAVAGPVESV